ncbi:hypothetical protein Metho_2678 (plasmid) [Methanomethylovorans hollandica DSM 15978]|uniref:Antitoxin SocA-like Panacea domain-containing protein n=1 Tax=Methanomethylovorans hollandica (strain DSM 15978 / NBRC 107637 / DMS1) TaxID=867904 RepID=L0L341_METHD|nr:hypothetical protein [Methanomethylovorans hollandica]AGB50808.1 hypothetical protein Metho_2678 [Methanomethylovorans hollandica DSM 15978]
MLDKIKQKAIIALLVERINNNNLWASPFFLQKAVFLLQELCKIQLGFNFYINKHAPFSDELQDIILEMRIDEILKQESNHLKPGNLIIGINGTQVISKLKEKPESEINVVIKIMCQYPPSSLEHLTSAIYVCKSPIQFRKSKSDILRHCNPFISKEESIQVINDAQQLINSITIPTKKQTA